MFHRVQIPHLPANFLEQESKYPPVHFPEAESYIFNVSQAHDAAKDEPELLILMHLISK